MLKDPKVFSLLPWRHVGARLLTGALAAALVLAPAAALAALPIEWQDGLMEARRYTISRDGITEGEIEARLYGEKGPGGARRLKASYDLVRNVEFVQGQYLEGRIRIDVSFDPETFDLLSRTDTFTIGQSEGKVIYTRTPDGVMLRSEGAAEGIPREPEEKTISYALDGPLIDESIFVYLARALPLEGGHTFEVSTVSPKVEAVEHLKGRVRDPIDLAWQGGTVEVYPVETSSSLGVATYYIRPDAAHTMVRYISVTGEVYEMQPVAAD